MGGGGGGGETQKIFVRKAHPHERKAFIPYSWGPGLA